MLYTFNRRDLYFQAGKLVPQWWKLRPQGQQAYLDFVRGMIDSSAYRLFEGESDDVGHERIIWCSLEVRGGMSSAYLKGWKYERGFNDHLKVLERAFSQGSVGIEGVACWGEHLSKQTRYDLPVYVSKTPEEHLALCERDEEVLFRRCAEAMRRCRIFQDAAYAEQQQALQLLRDIFAKRELVSASIKVTVPQSSPNDCSQSYRIVPVLWLTIHRHPRASIEARLHECV